jgi:hypothetical protein
MKLTTRLLWPAVLVLLELLAYFWSGLSVRALVCFDRTGLEPGEPGFGLPIDYTGTLFRCLGPIGWIVGLGVLGVAFAMALVVYRLPWPLRVILAIAAPAMLGGQIIFVSDLHPWVRPVCLQIATAEMVLAVLAAVFCRQIARFLPRWVVPK